MLYFGRKLSRCKVGRLLPRILHGHPGKWHPEARQRSPTRGQSTGRGLRRKPGLYRLHHVHRPGLVHQQDLLRHRDRVWPESDPHRRAPPLHRPQLHAGRAADVGGFRQPSPAGTKGLRVRARSAGARDRETDLHAEARGLLRAGDSAGDRGGGSGPCVLLRSDRGPQPGALGPGTGPARPLGVLVALRLPAARQRAERRGALVLQNPLPTGDLALGQPIDPSARDVSVPELKPLNETQM